MSTKAIRAALEGALDGISPALATAWENVSFTPQDGVPYQRVFVLFAPPENPEYGGLTTQRGFLQVSLCYPKDEGPGAASTRAELIKSVFTRGTSLTASGVTTTIERTPEVAPALNEDDRYVVPVRIRFYAHHS